MTVYTYSEARQNLADLLDRAGKEGEIRIRRRDGREYVLRPQERDGSPLDVPPVRAQVDVEEIVGAVREGRERAGR